MSKYDFRPSNVPNYGLGVDFGSMDTKGTLYGQNPTGLTTGRYAFTSTPEYINASPEIQKLIAEKELGNTSFNDIASIFKGMKPTLAEKEADLNLANTFQERQQRAALPYNMLNAGVSMLSKLPEQIATNAANRAMLNVLGARSATEAFNQTMASYPKSNFQSSIPLVQRNYFT